MTFNYDKKCDPPAPKAKIKITSELLKTIGIGSDVFIEVKMLIDTGSDISIIPKKVVKRLEKKVGIDLPYEMQEVEDFNGIRFLQKSYVLKLQSQKKGIGDSQTLIFLESTEKEGILGRDVLNDYYMHLNGPQQVWSL